MPRAANNSPRRFADKVYCDVATKSAIACRDGILQYDGSEIGEEPGRMYRVYRSPASTAIASQKMQDIALVDEHIDMSEEPANPVGVVECAELVDLFDSQTRTTMGVKTHLQLTDEAIAIIESGKRELSLGYDAILTASATPDFDFMQSDIRPHHLAIVERGRAGSACAFLDRAFDKKVEGTPVLKTVSLFDEGEEINLEAVALLVQQLPEAIKKVPLDVLKGLVPQLQAVVEAASAMMPKEEEPAPEAEETADEDKAEEDKKQQAQDAATLLLIDRALQEHTATIERARDFVDADYKFAGKSTMQIMRDAVAAEHGNTSFTDDEIKVAFKMLKRASNAKLAQFGDSNTSNPFWDLVD